MRNKLGRSNVIVCLICLFFPIISFTLPSDKNQPATISSNSADYNQDTGKTIFFGNVVITQGSTKITANQITTYTNKNQHLTKAIAIGTNQNPAVYQTVPKKGDALFSASAKKIEYLPEQNNVLLIGNAKLEQAHNTLKSDYIIYNQKTGQLQTKFFGKQRTTIVIQPTDTDTQK